MPPSVGRFAARLRALPIKTLIDLAARGCHALPELRRDADAQLAKHDPLPAWAVTDVLLSPDLLPQLFESLEVADCAAALVSATAVSSVTECARHARPR